MIARVLRWGAALLVATVAIACVLVGWLEDPKPIDAAGAVTAARAAFRRSGVDAVVDAEASPGVYDPRNGGPVEVFTVTATIDGAPVVLYLRQSDAAPVYLDDHDPAGGSQLSDVAFSRFISHVDNPARHDLVVRNLLLTFAAALIVGVAVLSLALDPDSEPS